MKYIKLFENYYTDSYDWGAQQEDDFIRDVLNLNVDSIKYNIESHSEGGAYYSDFIEGSMREEGGFYTWYKDFGTPLHYLVSLETGSEEEESKKYEMINLIGSCCIQKQDVNGNTPLHIVAMRNDLEMMEHLLVTDAEYKDLEIKNNEGMTPFIVSACSCV